MMESWHRVGQKVVYIDDKIASHSYGRRLHMSPLLVGEVYTIAKFGLDRYGYRTIQVEEHDDPHFWWKLYRFRPVRETSIEQFRALLAPTPEVLRALEDA